MEVGLESILSDFREWGEVCVCARGIYPGAACVRETDTKREGGWRGGAGFRFDLMESIVGCRLSSIAGQLGNMTNKRPIDKLGIIKEVSVERERANHNTEQFKPQKP